jgi:hypothetical protein
MAITKEQALAFLEEDQMKTPFIAWHVEMCCANGLDIRPMRIKAVQFEGDWKLVSISEKKYSLDALYLTKEEALLSTSWAKKQMVVSFKDVILWFKANDLTILDADELLQLSGSIENDELVALVESRTPESTLEITNNLISNMNTKGFISILTYSE